MALIDFEDVDLNYPVRENRGLTLKDLILKTLFRKEFSRRWTSVPALRQLSFKVGEGERLAIIGRNGAGKSTLLRAIGGVYPVHAGRRSVVGSICSLFDIRFRGYLQGETPRGIDAKLDEIAEFTELGEFLNLPLQCYSTGMIMRLAFAIATSGHPEILLVDEVFSTGDLAFQKKAQDRMVKFMDRARIVVMVGHNLEFLQKFSTRVIWMEHGSVHAGGSPTEIIGLYCDAVKAPRLAA